MQNESHTSMLWYIMHDYWLWYRHLKIIQYNGLFVFLLLSSYYCLPIVFLLLGSEKTRTFQFTVHEVFKGAKYQHDV